METTWCALCPVKWFVPDSCMLGEYGSRLKQSPLWVGQNDGWNSYRTERWELSPKSLNRLNIVLLFWFFFCRVYNFVYFFYNIWHIHTNKDNRTTNSKDFSPEGYIQVGRSKWRPNQPLCLLFGQQLNKARCDTLLPSIPVLFQRGPINIRKALIHALPQIPCSGKGLGRQSDPDEAGGARVCSRWHRETDTSAEEITFMKKKNCHRHSLKDFLPVEIDCKAQLLFYSTFGEEIRGALEKSVCTFCDCHENN